jgi:hypothetical protein
MYELDRRTGGGVAYQFPRMAHSEASIGMIEQSTTCRPDNKGTKGSPHACASTKLRMLQQGFAAGGDRRGDLLVRMHLLPGLRRHQARRPLPQLRRQSCRASNSACGQAYEISRLDRARVQAAGMRPRGLTDNHVELIPI